MKRNESSEDNAGEGPSKIPKKVSSNIRPRYTSKIQSSEHGFDYQKKVAILLLLRATNRGLPFSLAYEMTNAGKFDDVIFIDEEKDECLLIQVKHAATTGNKDPVKWMMLFPDGANKGNNKAFNLDKYLESFPYTLPDLPKKKLFMIFTNRELDVSDKLKEKVTITEKRFKPESILYFNDSTDPLRMLEPNDNVTEKMMDYINQDSTAKPMTQVTISNERNTSESILNDSTDLPRKFDPKHDVAEEMMDYALSEKVTVTNERDTSESNLHSNDSSDPQDPNDDSTKDMSETEIRLYAFFKSLALLLKQPDDLKEIIQNELLDWIRTWMHPVHFGKIDTDDNFEYCFTQLEKCLYHGYNRETSSNTFLTLDHGNRCLSTIQQHLTEKIRMLNYANSTLAKVEDYYVGRRVSLSDTNYEPDVKMYDFYELLTNEYDEEKIIVLTAKPGMGKSVLFYHLSHHIQRNKTKDLVFLIYLNNLIDNLRKIEQADTLETTLSILENVLVTSNHKIIVEASKCKSPNGQRIRIFLDGFDEIAPMHEKKVIQMIQILKEIKCMQIIVSGRRHVEHMFREEFEDVKLVYLEPFCKKDQTDFLGKKWKISAEKYSKFITYSGYILDEFQSCIDNQWCDFLGIPLIIEMYAEVKKHDFNRFLSSNEAQYTGTLQSFTVVKLYETFVNNSLDLKFEKVYQSGCREHESKEEFFLKHQLLAVRQLRCEELLDNPSMKTKFDLFEQKIKKGEERSPLVECVDGNVQFIHQSYAEYMVAKYLFDNIEESNVIFKPGNYGEYDLIGKFVLNMIEEQKTPEHFRKISEMSKIHNYTTVHMIFRERCFKILEYLIDNNSSFVRSFYQSDGIFKWCCQPIHLAAKYGYEKIAHKLIVKGTNIFVPCSDGLTPLHYALDHKGMIQLLLNYSVNVNVKIPYKGTPLHKAIEENKTKNAKMIIEHRIDENIKIAVSYVVRFGKISILRPNVNKIVYKNNPNSSEGNPHHSAVLKSFADTCKDELDTLLPQISIYVNFEDFEGKTALHYAAETTELDLFKLLLEKSTSVNLQDNQGKIPLHYAVHVGQADIVELLLAETKDVYLQDFKGKTPLHYAAEAGHYKIVERLLLLKTGYVNFTDIRGMTPLHYASEARHYQIIELLLKQSEDVDQDVYGRLPLDCALFDHDLFAENSTMRILYYYEVIELLMLKKLEHINTQNVDSLYRHGKTLLHNAAEMGLHKIVILLLENSADVRVRDYKGKTALHYAVEAGHEQIFDLLLQKSANVNAQDRAGKTPLHHAAQAGLIHMVKRLLNMSADVNLHDLDGKSPLHCAAHEGQEQIIKVLLENSADTELRDDQGKTVLHYAVKAGHAQIIDLLLQKSANVNAQDRAGNTPLHYAANLGYDNIVEQLLLKTIECVEAQNVNLSDNHEKTTLHYAAEAGLIHMVERLLNMSADVNLKDQKGKTPLHCTAHKGHEQIIKLLMENSADVNSQDLKGKTPLHCAAHEGHEQIIKLLLENSADTELRDEGGKTALHYAVEAGHKHIIDLLLKKSVNANAQDRAGNTPLHYAANRGYDKIVKQLLLKTIECVDAQNVNLFDNHGKTRLHYAAESGLYNVVERLLSMSADVNLQDFNDEKTPLHFATYHGHKDIIKLLLEKSVKVDAQDKQGNTPLHYALIHNYDNIVELLLEKSADVDAVCVNLPDKHGKTHLHYAVYRDQVQIVELLVENSVDVNIPDHDGKTPLHHAVELNRNQKIWTLLMENSANVNPQDINRNTPLHYAVERGNEKIIEALLHKSADVNLKNISNNTPLLLAVKLRRRQIVEFLLGKSADVNLKDSEGATVLHYAAQLGYYTIVERLSNTGNFLLQDNKGRTPLHYAAEAGQQKIVELLMKKSENVDFQDMLNETQPNSSAVDRVTEALFGKSIDLLSEGPRTGTLLNYAARNGCPEIVECLMENCADVNSQNESGETLLHKATMEGQLEAVKLLLGKPANVNLKDLEGRTPLHYAAEKGNLQIVELLLEKSGDVSIQDNGNKLPIHFAARAGHHHIVEKLQYIAKLNVHLKK